MENEFVEFTDASGARVSIRPDAVIRVVAAHPTSAQQHTRIIDLTGETLVITPHRETCNALGIPAPEPAKSGPVAVRPSTGAFDPARPNQPRTDPNAPYPNPGDRRSLNPTPFAQRAPI